MSLKEILTYGGGAFLLLSMLIQVSPIKVDPWTWIAKSIGNALNKDLTNKVDKLSEKVDKNSNDVQTLRDECEEREARTSRTHILRFGDEVRHSRGKQSKEHFDQIMRDIKIYEDYCESHPQFENNVCVETIKILKEVYRDCLKNNSFLE